MSSASDTGGSARGGDGGGLAGRAGTSQASTGPANAGQMGVFGAPSSDLVDVPSGAVQYSPLFPRSETLDALPDGSLSGFVMLALPGTLERRYAMAHAIRASRAGARMTFLAPKDKGGARLARELEGFGATVEEASRRHHRICTLRRPAVTAGLTESIAAGAPRFIEPLGLWSQPGLFSWDKIDAGSAMLVAQNPAMTGIGADFGCGTGYLAKAVLAGSPGISKMTLLDVDRRAIDCARRNVEDPRARFAWADVGDFGVDAAGIDFVVMNPPFHDGGAEDRALGLRFIRRAAEVLKRGGRCWLVANRHLPYEAAMMPLFASVRAVVQQDGYKVYEAVR